MEKSSLNNIISFITIIVIGVITVIILSYVLPNERINKEQVAKEVIEEVQKEQNKPSNYPDYDLTKSFKSVKVAENISTYAEDPDNIIGRVKKKLYSQGKFERMYILIEASVDFGKPLTAYDDIYLTFNYEGGHILPSDSLKTPPSEISSLLYSARELPYKKGVKSTTKDILNVLDIFNNSKGVGIDIFLSSARKGGMIKNFTIYYECKEADCEIKE